MRHPVLSDQELAALLADDVPCGDLTTDSLRIGPRPARLSFCARGPMTVCGVEEAARLFELNGARVRLEARSGESLSFQAPILTVDGSAEVLHRTWKTAQVLVEWASGIASAAAAIVQAAQHKGKRVPVACTRKTVPGTKALSVKAVRCAGATMHRLGLSETLLVFPEHRLYLDESPAVTVARLRAAEPEKKVVVEVGTVDEALAWAQAGAHVVQTEKFPPDRVAECRAALDVRQLPCLLAAAGGVKADNAEAYVAAGADLLVSSAPFSASPRDVKVQFFGDM